MHSQIKLGRIFGVEIGVHYSWFIIALLITFSLAAHFQATNPEWGRNTTWTLAIATALLFFATILAHELSHAAVATARGLRVRSITLFALGGLAQIEAEAKDAKTEFWMGIVGPITSALIGFVCLGMAWAFGWAPMEEPKTPLLAMVVWLGYINISLAIFNMIPGFPLDGGRILRAILWWTTGDPSRSTRTAARVGQMVALGFIALGLWRFFGGAGFGGLWIAFIGWFLLAAAGASYAWVTTNEALSGVLVEDVMSRDCPSVDAQATLQAFVDDYLLHTGRRCFVVMKDGKVAGIITPQEVKEVERTRWPSTTVSEAMRPLEKLQTVAPGTSAAEALEKMGREDVNQLPVMSEGRLEGVISRGHILKFLQVRAELKLK